MWYLFMAKWKERTHSAINEAKRKLCARKPQQESIEKIESPIKRATKLKGSTSLSTWNIFFFSLYSILSLLFEGKYQRVQKKFTLYISIRFSFREKKNKIKWRFLKKKFKKRRKNSDNFAMTWRVLFFFLYRLWLSIFHPLRNVFPEN